MAKSSFLVVAILLSFLLVQCRSSYGGPSNKKAAAPLAGGWTPIKNLADPHVVDIANFAVSEHNKGANSNLALSRIVSGATQVVSGTNYRLIVTAKDGSNKQGSYEVIVWEKIWEKFRELTSFKPLNH